MMGTFGLISGNRLLLHDHDLNRECCAAAIDLVEDGMRLGLGTRVDSARFVDALATGASGCTGLLPTA